MRMSSHSWLLMVGVALCAAVVCARSPLSLTDDPIFNKILSTTEESKPDIVIKKWSPETKIPLADDPR